MANWEQENILVLPRDVILKEKSWHGFNPNFADQVIALVGSHKQFLPRDKVEKDPNFKQIIPYIVFSYQDRYWITQRTKKSGDPRLHYKYSLGIGGHINEKDVVEDDIFSWAKREFEEEVEYDGNLDTKIIGTLNDDSDSVGQVHLGIVILAKGNSPNIATKEDKHRKGQLLTLKEMYEVYYLMENWSQFVFDHLRGVKK